MAQHSRWGLPHLEKRPGAGQVLSGTRSMPLPSLGGTCLSGPTNSFGGTCLSGPLFEAGSSIRFLRARQACPSVFDERRGCRRSMD